MTWAVLGFAQTPGIEDLARLTPGRTKAENALWLENDLSLRFNSSKRVVVADLKGPAVITMIHFALPADRTLNRDVLLRMYWDGETSPSVDVPLVDFFCDPAGLRDSVNTSLVNKRRGFNAYFPMPFRKSAKIELVYEGSVEPGQTLWKMMPCYSYVNYRSLKKVPADSGYFHASWRQETLLMGKRDYVALDAKGKGKFIGWNVTVRRPGLDSYPVDENEKFYIDGERTASIEYQGLEDSFGFSWGFPETDNLFPLTGYFKFMKGAAAYRFFTQDAISFDKSLHVAIGFGVNEGPFFRNTFSKDGTALQFSTTVYWYQIEPHAPFPTMLPIAERAPAPEQAFWPDKATLSTPEDLKKRGVKLQMLCGRPEKEIVFAEDGYNAKASHGFAWNGWAFPVYHARADTRAVEIQVTVPKMSSGLLRVYVLDADNYDGGRKQKITLGHEKARLIENFSDGRWLERRISSAEAAEGTISIRATNARKGGNAVISIVEWVEGTGV